jgi:hypothetical protein
MQLSGTMEGLETNYVIDKVGEPGWFRTIDPLIKSQMLYR